ncbi:MAG: hypothetical protein U0528_07850 [Anaerolineae bacterium]
MSRFIRLLLSCVIILILLPTFPAVAITLPSGFTETTLASSLGSVTAMEIAPDGRIFVLIQNGAVRVIKNEVLLTYAIHHADGELRW